MDALALAKIWSLAPEHGDTASATGSAGARLMLVNVYMKQRRYREALDQLNAYLAETPASPERKAAEQLQSQIQRALPR